MPMVMDRAVCPRAARLRDIVLASLVATAAVIAATQAASAQTLEKPYCLESQAGAKNCIYESLERCQQMAQVRTIGGRCVINPAQAGTIGAGGMDAPRGTGSHSLDRVPAPVR
jgi:Protein of unknown function (DUF3551)